MKVTEFRVVPGHLTEGDFYEFPSWAWYEEPSDLEVVVSWGVNTDVMGLIREAWLKDENNVFFPILADDPFSTGLRLQHHYFRGQLASGLEITGYRVDDHAFGVFVDGDDLVFNFHPLMRDLFAASKTALASSTGLDEKEIFPISFKTVSVGPDGPRLGKLTG